MVSGHELFVCSKGQGRLTQASHANFRNLASGFNAPNCIDASVNNAHLVFSPPHPYAQVLCLRHQFSNQWID